MNRLDMESKNIVNDNISKLKELFPSCVSEGNINFDILKQELSSSLIDDKKEKYELTWPGKKQAIFEGNKKTTNTLIPIKEKSVDFDNTKNTYIEGDNLEVLKILQESYLNKIKCIYIDPPYETNLVYESVKLILEKELIKNESLIIIETDQEERILERLKNLNIKIVDKRKYGRAHLIFLKKIR